MFETRRRELMFPAAPQLSWSVSRTGCQKQLITCLPSPEYAWGTSSVQPKAPAGHFSPVISIFSSTLVGMSVAQGWEGKTARFAGR